jgi:hypothetical protein
MTAFLTAAALTALGLLDGAFAGFRASAGRTGLIDHRHADHLAGLRGAALACILLTPATALTSTAVVLHPPRLAAFARAGQAMLAIYGPYGLIILAALACYTALGWRNRYLASAVILGPLTWLRPAVAVTGAILADAASPDPLIWAAADLAVAAVLAVEPLAGRLWYAPAKPSRPDRAACRLTSRPHTTSRRAARTLHAEVPPDGHFTGAEPGAHRHHDLGP